MITVHRNISTTHDKASTFGYIGDFSNTEHWDPGVKSAEKKGDDPIQEGTEFSVLATFAGREVPMTYIVTRWDPPNRVTLRGEGPAVIVTDDIRFEHTNGTTRIFYHADFEMKGVRRFGEPLLKPLFKRLADVAMDGMQSWLDSL